MLSCPSTKDERRRTKAGYRDLSSVRRYTLPTFTIDEDRFMLNGKPFRILSGAMHYFRVLPEYWEDRLRKLRGMGLNTLETYVAWNMHEPSPGEFRFDGGLDLARYVRLAADLGLWVILRPGPYVCSEWDLGGLPSWLLSDPGMRLRCAHKPYLEAVDRFFDALLPQVTALQITRGGPILAMQIENEYGSYGNDKVYLQHLSDRMQARGVDVLLFTSDGPTDAMLQYGTLPDVFKTVNFGNEPESAFTKLREYQPKGPPMCMEYWNGWFDHWGEEHHTRSAEDAAAVLDRMLAAGGSVNLYMAHGGTNFGFMNGANCQGGQYQPTITSYDDDAPVDEAGDLTPKYMAFREVIARYEPVPDLPSMEPSPKMALGEVELTESVGLFEALDTLSSPAFCPTPEPMENLGQDTGFILYRTQISGPREEAPLILRDLRDRAQIFLDDRFVGVMEREFPEKTLSLTIPRGGAKLEILVENQGRVNYGPDLLDRKGVTEGVLLGQQYLYGWEIFPLPLKDLTRLRFSPAASTEGPAFYRGLLTIENLHDTFLALPGWTKGVCWINGFNLGRYWNRGPQRTLYLPAPLLRKGTNELVVFELHGTEGRKVEFRDRAELG